LCGGAALDPQFQVCHGGKLRIRKNDLDIVTPGKKVGV
jgi:hypothetical protein